MLRHAVRGDSRDTDSVGVNAIVRASLFVTRRLYVGAELGLTPPDLVPLYARAAGASAHLEDPLAGAYAGAAFRLGAFRLKGELLVGARALLLSAPGPEGGASRLVVSGLLIQPRVGVDLWLGRHVTVGMLAGWTREVVSIGLTLGLHLAPRDRC